MKLLFNKFGYIHEFTGPLYGENVFKKYKKPNILSSKVLYNTYYVNNFRICPKSNGVYSIHHGYTDKLTGKCDYYNFRLTKSDIYFNENNNEIKYIIPEKRPFIDTGNGDIFHNVPVTVKFTTDDFNKLNNIFELHESSYSFIDTYSYLITFIIFIIIAIYLHFDKIQNMICNNVTN